jgi:hypothetical protein
LGLKGSAFLFLDRFCKKNTFLLKIIAQKFADIKKRRTFASTLLCLFVWVFRALFSDKGNRVFFCSFLSSFAFLA